MVNTKSGYRLKLTESRSINVRKVLAQLPTDECVEWPGARDKQGYGRVASRISSSVAHRYVYYLFHGKPDLPELDHLCRNRACCNPAHLEPVTAAENAGRRKLATFECRNGHPYGVDEYRHNGMRYCRECRRANDRKRPSRGVRAKQKEAAA